jgi:hypothetical protein
VPRSGAEAPVPPQAPGALHESGVVRAGKQRRGTGAAEGRDAAARFSARSRGCNAAAFVPPKVAA